MSTTRRLATRTLAASATYAWRTTGSTLASAARADRGLRTTRTTRTARAG